MIQPMAQRAQLITQRILNGETYKSIGNDLGISRPQVQQIANRYGVRLARAQDKPLTGVALRVAGLLESEPRLS